MKKRIKLHAIEKDPRNIGSAKWAVIGKVSEYIYYEGTHFDCCWYVSKKNNRLNIEVEEGVFQY